MSCNGCRILRKGCSENCTLRQSLEGTDYSPQAQANATLFIAKFFGRARLMSFLSSVPQSQRPALFRSLLHEACGRTVNPITGALGLLSTGNWHVCQSAVNNVLDGRMIRPLPLLSLSSHKSNAANIEDESSREDLVITDDMGCKRKASSLYDMEQHDDDDDLAGETTLTLKAGKRMKRRQASPLSDDQSVTTTLESNTGFSSPLRREFFLHRDDDSFIANNNHQSRDETKLLRLFI